MFKRIKCHSLTNLYMRIITILFAILLYSNVYAQKEKITSLKSVRGEYSVILEYSDVTGREAMQLAREDAKRRAIEKVCGTRINIWDQIESSSAGDVFNSLSINQIDGEQSIIFEVKVAEADMGKVIGKQGVIAKSIRTIMKSLAAKENKRVSVEFLD